MSVTIADLKFYGSADMPDGDGLTTGGAVNFAIKIDFSDMAATGTMNYVSSSSSDTATTISLYGRDATGVIQTEIVTLNGTTVVSGAQSFQRLLKGLVGGTAALGDVAAISNTAAISGHTAQSGSANAVGVTPPVVKLQSGDGATVAAGQIVRITSGTGAGQLREIIGPLGVWGTDIVPVGRNWTTVPDSTSVYSVYSGMLFDLAPNQITQVRRPFYNAASDVPGGATRTYFEKVFAVNTNAATALTVAELLKEVDPASGTLEIALCNALNDTATVANRQTAPASGITSFTAGAAPQGVNVPSPQNLPAGGLAADAQGVWLSLQLTAGLAPANTSQTLRITGQTT